LFAPYTASANGGNVTVNRLTWPNYRHNASADKIELKLLYENSKKLFNL